MRHNEIYLSEDKEALEMSVPGKIETVNVERPAGLPEKLTPVGRVAIFEELFARQPG